MKIWRQGACPKIWNMKIDTQRVRKRAADPEAEIPNINRRKAMLERRITIHPDIGDAFEMIIPVPEDRDEGEYIGELLDYVFSDRFSWTEWDYSR